MTERNSCPPSVAAVTSPPLAYPAWPSQKQQCHPPRLLASSASSALPHVKKAARHLSLTASPRLSPPHLQAHSGHSSATRERSCPHSHPAHPSVTPAASPHSSAAHR